MATKKKTTPEGAPSPRAIAPSNLRVAINDGGDPDLGAAAKDALFAAFPNAAETSHPSHSGKEVYVVYASPNELAHIPGIQIEIDSDGADSE